jgi:hypothetical protein
LVLHTDNSHLNIYYVYIIIIRIVTMWYLKHEMLNFSLIHLLALHVSKRRSRHLTRNNIKKRQEMQPTLTFYWQYSDICNFNIFYRYDCVTYNYIKIYSDSKASPFYCWASEDGPERPKNIKHKYFIICIKFINTGWSVIPRTMLII